MHDRGEIVMNTGPLIALAAALEDLSLLDRLYRAVHVPYEVAAEVGGMLNRLRSSLTAQRRERRSPEP